MSYKLTFKSNLKFPDLSLNEELLQVANKVIIPDIHKKIDSSVSISNVRYEPLAPSTIKQKIKKGLNTGILQATGKLRRSVQSQILGENKVLIFLEGFRPDGKTNTELGDILQNKGVHKKSGKRYFEFFGISREAEKESVNELERIIRKKIKSA